MRFFLVTEQREEYSSEFEAIRSIAAKLGIGSAETLRKWVRRAEIDSGARPGVTSAEHKTGSSTLRVMGVLA